MPDVDPDRALLCSLLDLTSLRAVDTRNDIVTLCERATSPGGGLPPVAAVCVHADRADVAASMLAGSPVRVAAVAGAFPDGRSPLPIRIAEIEHVVAVGVDEVDVVIDRAKALAGQWGDLAKELGTIRRAAGETTLKIILEGSELPDDRVLAQAAQAALDAGADFLKTSTGRAGPATSAMVDVLLATVQRHGRGGVKVAGGVRSPDEALRHVDRAIATFGQVRPDNFRIGASSLLDTLVHG